MYPKACLLAAGAAVILATASASEVPSIGQAFGHPLPAVLQSSDFVLPHVGVAGDGALAVKRRQADPKPADTAPTKDNAETLSDVKQPPSEPVPPPQAVNNPPDGGAPMPHGHAANAHPAKAPPADHFTGEKAATNPLADAAPVGAPPADAMSVDGPPADVPPPDNPSADAPPIDAAPPVNAPPPDVGTPGEASPPDAPPVDDPPHPPSQDEQHPQAPPDSKASAEFPSAPKDPHCSKIHESIIAANAKSQVFPYCSFKFNLRARPTTTTTVTTTVVSTSVVTYTTSTKMITKTAENLPSDAPLETFVVTKTLFGTDRTTVSATLFPTEYYACLSGGTGQRKLESRGQEVNTMVPKPQCFESFTQNNELASACACLGLPTARTATTTHAVSSHSTVFSSVNEVATSTTYVMPEGTTFSVRIPPTTTHLINSRTTATYTRALATKSAFALLGSNNKYARVDSSRMLHFSANYSDPISQVPTLFHLDTDTCALTILDGVCLGAEGAAAMEALNPSSAFGETPVRFEQPTENAAGLTALLCHIEESTQRLLCTSDGDVPSGGTMRDSEYWRLGVKASEDFTIQAVPLEHNRACFAQCQRKEDLLWLDGDQFVGQTVLQNCLGSCVNGGQGARSRSKHHR